MEKMNYDKMMSNIPLKNKLWKEVENFIDERFLTDISPYKASLENKLEMQDIVDALSDLAWKIECEMKDSL